VASSISVDEFIALNDEIAGLVRAGVPLDSGLARWSRDVGGRLGHVTAELSAAAARGESLDQSLEALDGPLPSVYRAVVVAGLKSGRLPAALESVSTSARHLQAARGMLGLALIYPLVLLLLGYGLVLILLRWLLPAILLLYDRTPPRFWRALIEGADRAFAAQISIPLTNLAVPVLCLPPLVLLAIVALWWCRTRSAMLIETSVTQRWLSWLPRAGRVARQARTASLAELLGLLVEQGVPLNEAIRLAVACAGERRLQRPAEQAAKAIEEGAALDAQAEPLATFGPSIAWLLSTGHSQRTFTAMARHVAATQRSRMALEIAWLRDYLPILLAITVGGAIAALLAVALFLPFTQLMDALSQSSSNSMRIR